MSMCLLLRAMTMPALKKRIALHPDHPFKKTEYYLLFTYYIDGEKKKLLLERGEDAAEVLFENGLISKYTGAGPYLTMYSKKMHTVAGRNGAPVQWAVESELEWKDIKLFNSDVLHIVANHEYELTGRMMGLIPYKPLGKKRRIETEFNRAA